MDDDSAGSAIDGASPQGVQLPRQHIFIPETRITLEICFCERNLQWSCCACTQLLGLENGDGYKAIPCALMVEHGIPQRFWRQLSCVSIDAMGWFAVFGPCISHNVHFHEVRGVERVVDIELAFEEAPAVA